VIGSKTRQHRHDGTCLNLWAAFAWCYCYITRMNDNDFEIEYSPLCEKVTRGDILLSMFKFTGLPVVPKAGRWR
jgi:hypothetical protein